MVSTSNKRSLRIRTGPHDYGPREWCVFFFFFLSLSQSFHAPVAATADAPPRSASHPLAIQPARGPRRESRVHSPDSSRASRAGRSRAEALTETFRAQLPLCSI